MKSTGVSSTISPVTQTALTAVNAASTREIPAARVEEIGRLKNSEHTTAALIQLKHGVDFDAIDNQPVDLLFALVVPEQATDDHLKILALLAGMFQDAAMRNKLRECHNPETMLKLIREWQPGH